MKLPGLMLLVAGWLLVLAALVVLPGAAARATFIVTGLLVELFGLYLLVRGEFQSREVSR
jgi:hypothetical protein